VWNWQWACLLKVKWAQEAAAEHDFTWASTRKTPGLSNRRSIHSFIHSLFTRELPHWHNSTTKTLVYRLSIKSAPICGLVRTCACFECRRLRPSPAQRTPMHAPQRLLPSLKARAVYRHPPPAPQPQQPQKTRQVTVRPARGRRGEALPSGRVHHAVFETRASDFIQRTARTSGRAQHTYPRPPKCGPVRATSSSHNHSCTYFRIHILQGAPCFAQERVHLGESGSRSLEGRRTRTPLPSQPPPALPCR